MAERGRIWTDNEIAALLAVWAEESIQRQFLGKVRNVVPYRAIADELRKKGFHRDFKQCREKIKQLKKKYKDAVDALRKSGVGIESDDDLIDQDIFVQFKWFSEMNGVLRRRAVVNPPSLLDTSNLPSPTLTTTQPDTVRTAESEREPSTPSASSSSTSRPNSVVTVTNESESEQSLGQPIQPLYDHDTSVVDTEQPPSATLSNLSIDESTATVDTQSDSHQSPLPSQEGGTGTPTLDESSNTTPAASTDSQQPGPSTVSRPKKRKVTKLEKVEKSNKLMLDMFMEAQEKAQKEMMELEHKRMKWEEEQAKREDEKDRRFMDFMKDMCFAFMYGPPPQMPVHAPGPMGSPPHFHMPVHEIPSMGTPPPQMPMHVAASMGTPSQIPVHVAASMTPQTSELAYPETPSANVEEEVYGNEM